jgi:uncharacterized protein YjcR
MHGGKGSGAPLGNQNAFKHGLYTADSLDLRRHVNALMREGRKVIEKI